MTEESADGRLEGTPLEPTVGAVFPERPGSAAARTPPAPQSHRRTGMVGAQSGRMLPPVELPASRRPAVRRAPVPPPRVDGSRRLILSILLLAASMPLPVLDGAGMRGAFRGYAAFLFSYCGVVQPGGEGWLLALAGALANTLHLAGLGLAARGQLRGRGRGIAGRLSALGLGGAVACLALMPMIGAFSGWWVWAASFAVHALPGTLAGPERALRWWTSPPGDLLGEAMRVLAFAAPASLAGSALLVPFARGLVPAGLLVSPGIAVASTVIGSSLLAGAGLRALARASSGGASPS